MENYHQSNDITSEAERLRLIGLTGNLASKAALTELAQSGFIPSAVLDAGCGTGDAFEVLHEVFPKAQVIGIDQSDRATEVAKQKNVAGEVVVGDIVTLSTNKITGSRGPFDLVFVRNTLLHIPNTTEALKQLRSVTSDVGFVLAIEPDWDTASANWPDFEFFKQAMMAAMRANGINPTLGQQLEQLFNAASFQGVKKVVHTYKTQATDEGWRVLEYLLEVSQGFIIPYLQQQGVESIDDMKERLRRAQQNPKNYFNTPAWVAVSGTK